MSNQLFSLFLSCRNHNEILEQAARMSLPDLELAAAQVRDEQVADIAKHIRTICTTVGVQHTLIVGGMLHLFSLVVQGPDRNELYDNLLEDLNIRRTQAYRAQAVWRCFGAEFLHDAALHSCFCAESLKVLAEERTPDDARAEAIELARNGEYISAKRAAALQKKHSLRPVANVSQRSRHHTRSRSSRWSFAGAFVRIQLIPAKANSVPDVSKMIADLEAAIAELKAGGPNARVA